MLVNCQKLAKITTIAQSSIVHTSKQVLHMLLCIFLSAVVGLSLSGCEKKIKNPLETPVPNTPEKLENWQSEIQKSYDMLTPQQQQTLSEYMLRKRLKAGEFSTTPVSIAEAIAAQQQFAKTHLNYRYFLDTKPKSVDSKDKDDGQSSNDGQRSKIVILPTYHFFAEHQTAKKMQQVNHFVDNKTLMIGLNNYGATDIGTIIGTVTVYSVAHDIKQTLNIPWTQYLPPLASGKTGIINIELPLQMEDTDKLERLISANDLQVIPDAIALYQANGKVIGLGKYPDLQTSDLQTSDLQASDVQASDVQQVETLTDTDDSTQAVNLDNANHMTNLSTDLSTDNTNEQIVYEKVVLQ